MGKKKKNKQKIDTSFMDFLNSVQNSPVDLINVPIVAKEIKRRIENGASYDDISSYKADTLRAVLSFFRISGRSKLTYKEDMAKRLVDVLGNKNEISHGKKSRDVEEKLSRRQEMTNLVLRNISKKGRV